MFWSMFCLEWAHLPWIRRSERIILVFDVSRGGEGPGETFPGLSWLTTKLLLSDRSLALFISSCDSYFCVKIHIFLSPWKRDQR